MRRRLGFSLHCVCVDVCESFLHSSGVFSAMEMGFTKCFLSAPLHLQHCPKTNPNSISSTNVYKYMQKATRTHQEVNTWQKYQRCVNTDAMYKSGGSGESRRSMARILCANTFSSKKSISLTLMYVKRLCDGGLRHFTKQTSAFS